MTWRWISAALFSAILACSDGHEGTAIGTPGIGVAAADLDSGSGRLILVDGGIGGMSEDGGVDTPEE